MRIKNIWLLILIIIVITQYVQTNQDNLPFEGKIWIYWNGNIQQSSTIVQLCYKKIRIQAQRLNYNLTLLNDSNLHKYISKYDQFQQALQKGTRQSVQAASDLIRITVIQQHGGVWFDISVIMFQGFQWLSKLETLTKNFIFNKYGDNQNIPDVFLFAQTFYQSRTWYQTTEKGLITQFPGYAIWFIAAKKNAKLMTDWKNKFYQIHQRKFQDYMSQYHQQNIFIKSQAMSLGYFSGNLALYYVVQSKQHQLDNNLTLFSPRITVFQYYKIWTIQAQVGPLVMNMVKKTFTEDFIQKTKTQLQQITGKIYYFVKLNGRLRPIYQSYLEQASKVLFDKSITFTNYLQKYAKTQDCDRIHFIVQDSIFDLTFKGIKLQNGYQIPKITLNQRQKWDEYCSKNSYKHQITFLKKIGRFFWTLYDGTGQYCKIQQILSLNQQDLSIQQKIKSIIQGNAMFLARIIVIPLITFILYFISQLVYKVVYISQVYILCKISNSSTEYNCENLLSMIQNDNKNIFLAIFNVRTLLNLIQSSMSVIMYLCIDTLLGGPEPYESFIYALGILIIQIIKYFCLTKNTNVKQIQYGLLIGFNQIQFITNLINNFFLVYCAFSPVQYGLGKLSYYSITIGFGIPFILNLIQSVMKINNQNRQNKSLLTSLVLFIVDILNIIYRLFPYMTLLLINILSNLRYIRHKNKYLLQIIFFHFTYFSVFLIGILSFIVILTLIIKRTKFNNLIISFIYCLLNLCFLYQAYLMRKHKFIQLYKSSDRSYFYYTLISIWIILGLQIGINKQHKNNEIYYKNNNNSWNYYQNIKNIINNINQSYKIIFQFIIYFALSIWLLFYGANYQDIEQYSKYQTVYTIFYCILNIIIILAYNKIKKQYVQNQQFQQVRVQIQQQMSQTGSFTKNQFKQIQ